MEEREDSFAFLFLKIMYSIPALFNLTVCYSTYTAV